MAWAIGANSKEQTNGPVPRQFSSTDLVDCAGLGRTGAGMWRQCGEWSWRRSPTCRRIVKPCNCRTNGFDFVYASERNGPSKSGIRNYQQTGEPMEKRASGCKAGMWFVTVAFAAFVAGCGDGIFGSGGGAGVPGAPPGAIIPGAVCTVAGAGIPTVTSSNPANGATNVPTGPTITATFNMAMNPATINSNPAGTLLTFTLKETAGANVPGTVAMNGANTIATFTRSAALLANTQYTATITQAATSAGGTPLGCIVAWSFTTGAVVPLAINLGSAATFGIASREGLTSTGVTVVNGNVALFPLGACTDATGVPANCLVESKPPSATGLTVNGLIRFPTDSDAGATASAVTTDLTAAWNQGMAMVNTQPAIAADELGGKTFVPGVYENANLTLSAGGIATLDPLGDPNAVFIFKVTLGGDLVDSGTLLLPSRIDLVVPAQARNVWFVVGRDITIGSGTTWNGNILANRTATVLDGSTVNGRVLGGAGGAVAITLTGAAAPSVTTITVP